MKKTIILFTFISIAIAASAQKLEVEKRSLVQDGVTKLEILRDKDPIPYPSLREDDIFWSRRVWRTINLRERMNFPLYYPTEVLQSRKSFAQAIVAAITKGSIKAYDTDTDEFTTELTISDVKNRFDAAPKEIRRQKLDGSGDTTLYVPGQFNWGEVQELLVKEDWYFDKHHSQMYVRIIGICLVRAYAKEIKTGNEEDDSEEIVKKQLFWIHYPSARKVLANSSCYVGESERSSYSFDDLFLQRRFSSYITAISNNQDYRKVSAYTRNGMEAMLESERLKKEIFDFESDLWEY